MATCDMCLEAADQSMATLHSRYQTKDVKSVCSRCQGDLDEVLDRMRGVQGGFIDRFMHRFSGRRRESAFKKLKPSDRKSDPGTVIPEWAKEQAIERRATLKERERIRRGLESMALEAKAKEFTQSWKDALEAVEIELLDGGHFAALGAQASLKAAEERP